jgi:hypothetical protein
VLTIAVAVISATIAVAAMVFLFFHNRNKKQ